MLQGLVSLSLSLLYAQINIYTPSKVTRSSKHSHVPTHSTVPTTPPPPPPTHTHLHAHLYTHTHTHTQSSILKLCWLEISIDTDLCLTVTCMFCLTGFLTATKWKTMHGQATLPQRRWCWKRDQWKWTSAIAWNHSWGSWVCLPLWSEVSCREASAVSVLCSTWIRWIYVNCIHTCPTKFFHVCNHPSGHRHRLLLLF